VQSSNLSSLTPTLAVYNSSLSQVGSASAPNTFGATISASEGVSSGQGYYIRVIGAGGEAPIGSYGLLVNFGNQAQSPIPPPNTVVAQQPSVGGGAEDDNTPTNPGTIAWADAVGATWSSIGDISTWLEQMVSSSPATSIAAVASDATQATTSIVLGVDFIATQQGVSMTIITVNTTNGSSTTTQATVLPSIGGSTTLGQAIDEVLDQLACEDN
jgi:hypothetical protein